MFPGNDVYNDVNTHHLTSMFHLHIIQPQPGGVLRYGFTCTMSSGLPTKLSEIELWSSLGSGALSLHGFGGVTVARSPSMRQVPGSSPG